MRALWPLLVLLAGCAAPEPLCREAVMPVVSPTDTLRVVFGRVAYDAGAGVLRLAGRLDARGPQSTAWTPVAGATITLRPPEQTDWSTGTPFAPLVMRQPFVSVMAGREGAFDVSVATPDAAGYAFEARWVGAFGLMLPVDSLLAAP